MTRTDDKKQATRAKLSGTTLADRRQLLGNGYEPIPIRGKVPRWQGWPAGEITMERLDAIEKAHPDHTGTGLRTGELSVADIDLTLRYDGEQRIIELQANTEIGKQVLQKL